MRDDFSLSGSEFIKLCDLLKRVGLCESGGAAKNVIGEGQVTVDGKVELRKRCKILAGQTVKFEDETVKVVE